MDDDFFQAAEETQPTQSSHASAFQFEDTEPSAGQLSSQHHSYVAPVVVPDVEEGYGGTVHQQQPEELDRIRQMQQEIHDRLLQKANRESELVAERKQRGRQQFLEFMQQREQQIAARRQQNRKQQAQQKQVNRSPSQQTPWSTIVSNIATKEGEYPGSKDIKRMREALLNKKQDEQKGPKS